MQLEGQPRDIDQAFFLQLFDSDRVDVAPGSNVVGEDDQLNRLDCLSHLFVKNRNRTYAIPFPVTKATSENGASPALPGRSGFARSQLCFSVCSRGVASAS